MKKAWSLKGRYALVTGGTKGIGKAIVREFLRRRANVFIVARGKEAMHELVSQYDKAGKPVFGILADVGTEVGRKDIIKTISDTSGRLDILVNNVGTNIRKKATDLSEEEYLKIMDTNLKSSFQMSVKAFPFLKESDQSSIVNISSVAGLNHIPTGVVYGMTKAAMIQMTKNLAVEWAEYGIRVNAVAPWYIKTPLVKDILENQEFYDKVVERTPLKKIGHPREVAAAVAFFCLPAASYITGQCLAVDGGFTINSF